LATTSARNVKRLLAAAVLLCSSCSHRNPGSSEQDFARASLLFRQGKLAQARDQVHAASQHCGSVLPCRWKLRLLEAEILIYMGKSADAHALLSESPPQSPDFAPVAARRSMLAGWLQSFSSVASEAEAGNRLLEQAHQQALRLGLAGLQVEIEILQASALSTRRPEEARSLFLKARELAGKQNDLYDEATALNDLGYMSLQQRRYDEAISWFAQTLGPARRVDARPLVSAALNNLALCQTQLGAYDAALKLQQDALAGTGEVMQVRRDLLGEMGRTLARKGDTAKAIDYYRQALDLSRNMQDDDNTRRWTSNLAAAWATAGNWDAAEAANREELSLAHDDRSKAYAGLNTAAIAAGRQRFDEAVALYRKTIGLDAQDPSILWESHAGLARAYAGAGKKLLARREFEEVIRIVDRNQALLSRDDYKLTFLESLIRFYRDYVDFLVESSDSDAALEIAESSRAKILAARTAPEKNTRRLSVRELQAAAQRAGVIFLSYWLAPGQSYVWIISPAQIRFFKLGPAADLESLVDRFNRFIGSSSGSHTIQQDPLTRENDAAQRLYNTVIGPAAPFIPAHAHVIIVPDGALHFLNFETLPVYGTNPHYWIEDVTVAVVPSLAIAAAAPAPPPGAPKSLLIMGDADYSGQDFPKLDYAPEEMEKIGKHFAQGNTKVFRGPAANPAAYRQADPQQFAAIHFSAHAEANQQSPLDSAIILSPGKEGTYKLYARDVTDVPLHADLVTISACHSAGARAYSGEGLVGFAWAFLRAGARYVIAGLWDVTDNSTPDMMDRFYGAIESGHSPADALRIAKLYMIHSTGAFRKPYYWGPFQIYSRVLE
jgi:CHAT domain-containing protein